MHIGMVTACYKPVINGVTQMIDLYRRKLTELGHQVTIFTLGPPAPDEDPEVRRSPGIPLGKSGYFLSAGYTKKIREELNRVDIIHCHHLFMALEFARRYSRRPIVYTNHTRYDLYTAAIGSVPQIVADALMRRLWPQNADFADLIIAPSASVQSVLHQFGVQKPIRVIHNGIELRHFYHPPSPISRAEWGWDQSILVICYVGRLAAEKNIDYLLAQFAAAQQTAPELRLLLVGGGPAQSKLQRQAQQLGVETAVHLTGFVPHQDVPNYLAAADIFATASLSEVHPLTLIEAAAAGLPVAALASPGITDIVQHETTGLLTPPTGDALAAALLKLAHAPALRDKLGQQARRTSQQYAIEKTVEETIAAYRSLLETSVTGS